MLHLKPTFIAVAVLLVFVSFILCNEKKTSKGTNYLFSVLQLLKSK